MSRISFYLPVDFDTHAVAPLFRSAIRQLGARCQDLLLTLNEYAQAKTPQAMEDVIQASSE